VFERSPKDEKPVLPGLIDVEKLKSYGYDKKNAGLDDEFAGSKRPQNGGVAGGSRVEPSPIKTGLRSRFSRFNGKNTDTGQRETEPVVIVAAGAR
jgi:hypothetical protein